MANTTPISNKLNVRLANMIDDPVSGGDDGIAASTDGKVFSANIRNQRLNEAYAWVVSELCARMGLKMAIPLLTDSIATQNVASTGASGDNANKDYLYPVKLVQSTQALYSYRIKVDLDADLDPYLDKGYAVNTGKLFVYTRNPGTGVLAIVAGINVTLHYLKADRIDTSTGSDIAVNTSPDTTLNSRWHEAVLLYAAYRLCTDKSAAEWIEKAKVFFEQANGKLPQAPTGVTP